MFGVSPKAPSSENCHYSICLTASEKAPFSRIVSIWPDSACFVRTALDSLNSLLTVLNSLLHDSEGSSASLPLDQSDLHGQPDSRGGHRKPNSMRMQPLSTTNVCSVSWGKLSAPWQSACKVEVNSVSLVRILWLSKPTLYLYSTENEYWIDENRSRVWENQHQVGKLEKVPTSFYKTPFGWLVTLSWHISKRPFIS